MKVDYCSPCPNCMYCKKFIDCLNNESFLYCNKSFYDRDSFGCISGVCNSPCAGFIYDDSMNFRYALCVDDGNVPLLVGKNYRDLVMEAHEMGYKKIRVRKFI